MQFINILTVLFYHTWFYVRYSYWCQSVFDREDKHEFCISKNFNNFINVGGLKARFCCTGKICTTYI